MIRVLIAAPTPALRAGLRALLSAADIEIVGEVAVLGAPDVDRSAVDVVLVADVELLAGANRAIGAETRMGMLMLANDSRAAELLRALPLVGWGILAQDASPAELQTAIRTIAQGLVVLPAALVEQLLRQRGPIAALAQPPAEPLTAREREVLQLVSQGLSNKLIARELQVSEHTVKFHISSIFAKLGAASRTEAISRGARQGLITL
jgi:DNA-binding NarL/FixJ family response regulator